MNEKPLRYEGSYKAFFVFDYTPIKIIVNPKYENSSQSISEVPYKTDTDL